MKSKRLLHNISGVALPVLFGVLLVVLWQTQVLHAWIGTDIGIILYAILMIVEKLILRNRKSR